ncbi:class I SAM-dependent methyltransferase [Nubsella zeaxanthinifaciens]|uniref:methyltransferase domain-containing protein n=1 Tax=Nubsella zeaxanthinifaciens TaxID=392412 RepID=UPI000DE4E8D1|nr:class I SAM-dependent methyltransferase [Nubsella zeaxanthinifaciens]
MTKQFDFTASYYDQEFTNTKIGIAQRNIVLKFLDKNLQGLKNVDIFELNCGTGEDAQWFGEKKQVNSILATDISEKMVEVAEQKNKTNLKASFRLEDASNLSPIVLEKRFDIIHSNFGGLNCLDRFEIESLLQQLSLMLKPNGCIYLVLMPTVCIWESFYFCLKLNWKNVFRRYTKDSVNAQLNADNFVKTWYYSPKTLKRLLPPSLKITNFQTVGFFIWPSYLNAWATKCPALFNLLVKLENLVKGLSFLCFFSDHYMVKITSSGKN